MSQAGIINVIDNNPTIPIYFEADTGFAVALFNVIRIVGAGGIVTSATGNVITVDGSGLSPDLTLTGDTGGPLSPTGDNWNIVGGSVAAGTTPMQVNGAVSTLTVNVQRTQASASSAANRAGIGSFDSAFFTVDANGYVSISGTAIGQTITGNSGGALSPVGGNWNILGAAVAAGTSPVASSGSGNTLTLNVQRAQAIAATNASNVGLAAFDNTKFTVDANGFVSISGTAIGQTITGNSGGALSPVAGNWNIVGTGSTTASGSGNTLTVQMTGLTNHAILVGAGTATITKLALGSSGQVLQSGGASADPAWSTATYPSTAGTTGTILRSNGTNFVNTTATYPTTTTINQLLYSSAANTITGLATANNSILSTDGSGVPSLGTSLNNNYTFTTSTAGGNRVLTVSNTDNTSATSEAIVTISTGGTSSGDPYSRYVVGTTRSYSVGIDNSDSQSFLINTAANATAAPSTGGNIFKMTSGGNRTMVLNACNNADMTNTVTDATGDGTLVNPVIFDGELFDQNSNYDPTTGLFTAPVTGKYLVTAALTFGDLGASHTSGEIRIVASGSTYSEYFNPGAGRDASNRYTASITRIVSVTATNTIAILCSVSGSTKTVDILGNSFAQRSGFCVNLIS